MLNPEAGQFIKCLRCGTMLAVPVVGSLHHDCAPWFFSKPHAGFSEPSDIFKRTKFMFLRRGSDAVRSGRERLRDEHESAVSA
jgi:hypothetical protein